MLEQLRLPIQVISKAPLPMPRGLDALLEALRAFQRTFRAAIGFLCDIFIRIATLPYYRLYHFNTIDPLNKIAKLASEIPTDSRTLLRAVSSWRARKLSELQFITISCTVLAAAVIGAFSWTVVEEAYWLTHGLWHSSLILSILGILLSASEVTVLHLLGPLPQVSRISRGEDAIERYRPLMLSHGANGSRAYVPRKKMVFTWQGPLMFMSYSVCAFLAGLTVLVCTPLIREGTTWTPGHNIAIMYLAVLAGAGAVFVTCSFWVYHYVELSLDITEDEIDSLEDLENVDSMSYLSVLMPSTVNESTINAARRQRLSLTGRNERS